MRHNRRREARRRGEVLVLTPSTVAPSKRRLLVISVALLLVSALYAVSLARGEAICHVWKNGDDLMTNCVGYPRSITDGIAEPVIWLEWSTSGMTWRGPRKAGSTTIRGIEYGTLVPSGVFDDDDDCHKLMDTMCDDAGHDGADRQTTEITVTPDGCVTCSSNCNSNGAVAFTTTCHNDEEMD